MKPATRRDAGLVAACRAAWKPRRGASTRLNQRILARARFFDSALRSVEDGLIIAGADGRITFVNRRAAERARHRTKRRSSDATCSSGWRKPRAAQRRSRSR